MASASFRSHLVLDPWTARMAQAWPRANGMPSARQVSASQYQQCMHSHPTRRSGRYGATADRKSTRLNSSHVKISYAVFCLKKKKKNKLHMERGRVK